MNKKKLTLLVVSLLLVCTVSVTGALAYLFDSANEGNGITNTFTAKGDGKMVDGTYEIVEPEIEVNDDGTITEKTGDDENTDEGNTYPIVAGQAVPKTAIVNIEGKTDVPAYLYIEVVDTLDSDVFSYEINDCWEEVTDATAPHENGTVYVYVAEGKPVVLTTDVSLHILKDDVVNVSADAEEEDLEALSDQTLTFYSYLAQATVGTPAEAFNACFGSAATTTSSSTPG